MLSTFAKCPSLVRNISKIDVEFWNSHIWINPPKSPSDLQFRSRHIVSAFLRNVPLMPRLHTATFYSVKLQQRHLALLFQSNSLHRLEISKCYLPRWVFLPPSPIRHLRLSLRGDCRHAEPLLGHCSPNLEALDFNGHLSQPPGSTRTRLPLFPKLRELKFDGANGSISDLDTLISLAPQLEHLEFCRRKDFIHRLSALPTLPASFNRFSTNRWAMDDRYFDTRLFIHLPHLHIKHLHEGDRRGPVIPIIRRIFPNLTSLELTIQWDFRNLALLHARHLPNVTRLKLNISCPTFADLDIGPYLPYFAAPGGPLASLHVNVDYVNEFHIETCKSWVIHTVLGPDPGLGGPYLQEVEVVFSDSESFVVREKRRWETHRGCSLGCIQSIQRNEERMVWAYSHGRVHEGPYVGDRDFRCSTTSMSLF